MRRSEAGRRHRTCIAGGPPASNALTRLRVTATKPEAPTPWVKGESAREVERLPREGKCVHKPPPEPLPQKGKHKLEVLPRGDRNGVARRIHEGLPPEVNRIPEVPSQKGRRKPEGPQPEGKRICGVTAQSNPTEGERVGGREALGRRRHKINVSPQEDPNEGERELDWLPREYRAKMSCPLGRDQVFEILEGCRVKRKFSIQKGLLMPTRMTRRLSTPATKQRKLAAPEPVRRWHQ